MHKRGGAKWRKENVRPLLEEIRILRELQGRQSSEKTLGDAQGRE